MRLRTATTHVACDAVSLIGRRLQFTHGAYKRGAWKLSNWIFSKCAVRNKFVLDSLALSGEPSKQALGKVAQSGATQFAKILLTAQFRRSLDQQACCIG
jgi:hypothetical protein